MNEVSRVVPPWLYFIPTWSSCTTTTLQLCGVASAQPLAVILTLLLHCNPTLTCGLPLSGNAAGVSQRSSDIVLTASSNDVAFLVYRGRLQTSSPRAPSNNCSTLLILEPSTRSPVLGPINISRPSPLLGRMKETWWASSGEQALLEDGTSILWWHLAICSSILFCCNILSHPICVVNSTQIVWPYFGNENVFLTFSMTFCSNAVWNIFYLVQYL